MLCDTKLPPLLITVACLAIQAPAFAADPPSTLFTVTVDVAFQTEEVNIPGWEDGPFSEPVGDGSIELRLAFPEGGGAPAVQAGDARITRYECVGSGPCTCTPPPDLLDRLWHPVILDRVVWLPDERRLTLMGPVTHPEDEISVTVRCAPATQVVVPDHPVYKLLGAFTESNRERWQPGFEVPLAGPPPWTATFERELFSDGPKVFRARLEFTVTEGQPAGADR